MIPPSSYNLSFPCPSCSHQLTIHTAEASGPCPKCQAPIEVQLHASLAPATVLPSVIPVEEKPIVLRSKFEKRRFRPASTAGASRPRSNQKLSDYAS